MKFAVILLRHIGALVKARAANLAIDSGHHGVLVCSKGMAPALLSSGLVTEDDSKYLIPHSRFRLIPFHTRFGKKTMVKRILVGLGGTPFSYTATRRAIKLALAHKAEITAVSVLSEEDIEKVGSRFYRSSHQLAVHDQIQSGEASERLERTVKDFELTCTEANIPFRILREKGSPFRRLISEAHYHDLTVVGLRAIFDYELVEEPEEEFVRLVRAGVSPILAVSEQYRTVERAMMLFNGSVDSASTLRKLVSLQMWPDMKLKIVAFQMPEKEAKESLSDTVRYCRSHGYEPEVEYVHRMASNSLVALAQAWNADLIALGNSAESTWTRRILGESVLHVVREADRPVFLA